MKNREIGIPESMATLGALLRAPYRRMRQRLYTELAEKFPEVREAHAVVFRHIAANGSRLTDLAEEGEMSKQSMAYLVGHLTGHGYLRAEEHPDDGRARKVLLTAKGRRFMDAALAGSARLEREAAEKMGEGRVREMRTLLTELGSVFSKID
jgi:DNA-binding MarR family transcriptional regulator